MTAYDYAVVIERLPEAEGSVYAAYLPDLPGCMSDGETREAAAHNVRDAIMCWIEAAIDLGRPIPQPRPQRVSAL